MMKRAKKQEERLDVPPKPQRHAHFYFCVFLKTIMSDAVKLGNGSSGDASGAK